MNGIKKIKVHMNRQSHVLIISIGFFLFCSGCNQLPQAKKHANWVDSTFQSDTMVVDTSKRPNEYCFIHVTQSDSSFVNLVFIKEQVTGKYTWIPFEKDSRTGTITGSKRGDTLDVVWNFMQEGVKDTLRTMFLLHDGTLKQRPFRVNQQTGRQQADQHAAFSILYKPIVCSK